MIPVCRVTDVPLGEGRALSVDGRRVALFHTDGGWYALDAACPHRGGPLADGIVADSCVICPLHDRRFELASGAALSGGPRVGAYRVELSGDSVLLELDESLRRAA